MNLITRGLGEQGRGWLVARGLGGAGVVHAFLYALLRWRSSLASVRWRS